MTDRYRREEFIHLITALAAVFGYKSGFWIDDPAHFAVRFSREG